MKKTLSSLTEISLSDYFVKKNLKHFFSSPEDLTDEQFRTINTYILGISSIIIILFCLIVNIQDAHINILYLLTFLISIMSLSILGMYKKIISVNIAQPLCQIILAFLGYYILLTDSYDPSGSLVWFIIFPPMLMFTSGLYIGIIFNILYFISLCMLVLTPLNIYLNDAFTLPQLTRFLIAFLGSFLFSACTEYFRHKTKCALTKAYQQNKQFAFTDPLTSLKNRRSFDEIIPQATEKLKESNSSYTLMFLDIDHFKKINDTYGHDIGDIVLQHISQILLSQKNASDHAFRLGGEEFVLFMAKLPSQQAKQVAERIRIAIEKTPCNVHEHVISYTVSIGYYVTNCDIDFTEALKLADQNLYKAKRQGRNCTIGNT